MEEAASAIIGASGTTLGSNTIRVSWGKERRSKPSPNLYSYNPYAANVMYTQAYAPYYAPGGDYPQYFSYEMAAMSPTYGKAPLYHCVPAYADVCLRLHANPGASHAAAGHGRAWPGTSPSRDPWNGAAFASGW